MPEESITPKLWIVLARAHRALSMLVERSIANTGLCLSDFMVLEALLHKGPLTITAIQDKVLLATGSMTAAVDRVESKGLAYQKRVRAGFLRLARRDRSRVRVIDAGRPADDVFEDVRKAVDRVL